jgi:hypothetical protein
MKRPKSKKPKWNVWLFRMAKLDVHPGDTVVLQTDYLLDKDQCEALRRNMDQQLEPLKVKCIILTAGLRVGVIRNAT